MCSPFCIQVQENLLKWSVSFILSHTFFLYQETNDKSSTNLVCSKLCGTPFNFQCKLYFLVTFSKMVNVPWSGISYFQSQASQVFLHKLKWSKKGRRSNVSPKIFIPCTKLFNNSPENVDSHLNFKWSCMSLSLVKFLLLLSHY